MDRIAINRITIIGNGNVGSHLYKAFSNQRLEVCLLGWKDINNIHGESNLLIIATKDEFIQPTARAIDNILPDFKGIVVHCAGSVGMNVLSPYFRHYGVIYPLQTFSKEIPICDYGKIQFFVEGSTDIITKSLKEITGSISYHVSTLDSAKRLKLHVASIFVCNFVNALYIIADNLLEDGGVAFETMHDLIEQTQEKAIHNPPVVCQTGPARRGDLSILNKHLESLEKYPAYQEIYKQISNFIYKKFNYGHE